jgi:hypothetical protein
MHERDYADKLVKAAEALEGRAHFLAIHMEEQGIVRASPLGHHNLDIRC